MRRHAPARAADFIATHLGHGKRNAGKAYRADCEGATAQAIWSDSRKRIAAQSASPAGNRRRGAGSQTVSVVNSADGHVFRSRAGEIGPDPSRPPWRGCERQGDQSEEKHEE